MVVGIKYCGGCRAAFRQREEAEAAVRAAESFAADVRFVPAEEGGVYDALLIVCGCRTSCPDLSPYQYPGKAVYLNEEGGAMEAAKELFNHITAGRENGIEHGRTIRGQIGHGGGSDFPNP
ncbi:MAG: hypothetical protein LBS85_01270 [Clostridiales Family XIII bacterium]|nr:hypothetical protein [Clostridiales Family XIII bacterium]